MMNRFGKQVLQDESGVLIIEALIALAILSVGVLAIAAMQITASRSNLSAREYMDLNTMAVQQMEQLLNQPYLSLVTTAPASDADGIDNDADGVIDETGEPAGRWAVSWTVANDAIMQNSRTIALTVTENTASGPRRLTLQNVVVQGQQ